MTDTAKQVVMWEPRRAEKLNLSGEIIPGEFVGKFRTKVAPNVPGAVNHKGRNDAGVEWDYWGKDVDSVSGVVRWIDVRSTDFGPVIALFLESDKYLHQITCPYDIGNIRTIMNHLCGLGNELSTAYINISYWVRKKMNAKGELKTTDKGQPIWAKDLYFRDVPVKFEFEEWKEFAAKNNLEWFKETRKGKEEWNYEAELNFWLSKVVAVQRFLLKTEKVLPFCWNSLTACEKPSPGGNLTSEEIEAATEIYERIKENYRFPFSRREATADEVDLSPSAPQPGPAIPPAATGRTPANTSNAAEVPFPTDDVTSYDEDHLPF